MLNSDIFEIVMLLSKHNFKEGSMRLNRLFVTNINETKILFILFLLPIIISFIDFEELTFIFNQNAEKKVSVSFTRILRVPRIL